MAYEFKRLSDVEVVAEPSESANVLIEEGGVIKKAPKTAVGGGKGEDTPDQKKWDAVIVCRDYVDNYNAELIQGDYSELRDKIISMTDMPNILVVEGSSGGGVPMSLRPTTFESNVGSFPFIRASRAISVSVDNNEEVIKIFLGYDHNWHYLTLYPNNMFYIEMEE